MPSPRIHVLVVDDDFATRLLASEALLADGLDPIEAEDGREALDQYDRASPALVLLDVHVPGIDGYEVCRRIRLRPGGESTAIMVMTATDDLDAVQRAFAAGATDFLTKPLNLPLLAHRVRYTLRAAATATAARQAVSRLARASRLARLVHWQLGADDQFAWAGDPLAVFWPDAPRDVGAAEPLLAYVHPGDRDRVAGVLAARAEHQLEFRLEFPDGSERFVHQDAEPEFGASGIVLIGATQDITEVRRAEQQIAQLAFYDDLTGIPNRPFVERYLRRADPAAARSAIAIDLGIRRLERLPPAARDAAIRAATARVIERVRGTDLENRLDQPPRPIEAFTGPTLVARTGPDELLVITTELTDGTGAATAYHLADVLAAPFAIEGGTMFVRPRIGVVDYPDPVSDLRRLPDRAAAVARDAGGLAGRVSVLTAAARARHARRTELAGQLAATLDDAALAPHAELAVAYAPRLDPTSHRVFGVRAQPRWLVADDPDLVTELLAADAGLRDRLTAWALAQACRDSATWLAAGIALRIAVELPHSMVVRPEFADDLQRRLIETGCESLLFDLELVDVPVDDAELDRLASALRSLRVLGPRTALACVDDRRSLGELSGLPLDTLRLSGATLDRLGPTFVTAVTAIARGLGLRIALAEITNPDTLAGFDGCELHELAGPLLGAPVAAAQVPALLEPAGDSSDPARRARYDSLGPPSAEATFIVSDL